MRTTLDIDEQVVVAARAIARDRGISMGLAVSELARKGLQAQRIDESGFPRFASQSARPITLEDVNDHRDD